MASDFHSRLAMRKSRVWAEIDLKALDNNFNVIKKYAGDAKINALLKANAYGHGLEIVGRRLNDKVDFFSVAAVEEAIQAQDAGITKPILVLGPKFLKWEIEEAVRRKLRITICHMEQAKIIESFLKPDEKLKVHIEVDTGMTRTGVDIEKFPELLEFIQKNGKFELEGVYTHYATADDEPDLAEEQLNRFKNEVLPLLDRKKLIIHTANSAAIFNLGKSAIYDMVRPGIAMFGLPPSPSMNIPELKPILSLKTRVIQIREIPPGRGIGYGFRFVSKKPMKIAVLAVGYGDGYPRALYSEGEVLIKGKRAKIVGVISMDLTTVDVTHIEGVEIGDVATLIGRDGSEEITATELAGLIGTINYEITTGLLPRVERIPVGD